MKRIFDIVVASVFLLLFSPLFLALVLIIINDSKGGAFFHQDRVGKNGKLFRLHKFRTMRQASEAAGQLTVGMRDPRITTSGFFLRKYKLDELPQLWNVLKGEMSLVGPRPEVPKYVAYYSPEQRRVLSVQPGLTDFASIEFVNENDILSKSPTPEKTYIEEILPKKIELSLRYIDSKSFLTDIKILWSTLKAIAKG